MYSSAVQTSGLLIDADSAVEKRQSDVPSTHSESVGLINSKNSDPLNAAAVYA